MGYKARASQSLGEACELAGLPTPSPHWFSFTASGLPWQVHFTDLIIGLLLAVQVSRCSA